MLYIIGLLVFSFFVFYFYRKVFGKNRASSVIMPAREKAAEEKKIDFKFITRYKDLKSPMYYWYNDKKNVTIATFTVSGVINLFLAIVLTGGSLLFALFVFLLSQFQQVLVIALIFLLVIADYYLPFSMPSVVYYKLLIPLFIASLFSYFFNKLLATNINAYIEHAQK